MNPLSECKCKDGFFDNGEPNCQGKKFKLNNILKFVMFLVKLVKLKKIIARNVKTETIAFQQ